MTARRHRAHLPLLVLALAATILAGCGGGASKDDYEAGLRRMQSQMDDATKASNQASGTVDAEERRAALGTAHAALEKAATTAEGLEPPDDVAKANDRMVDALRDYADLFDELAKLDADDPAEAELYGEAGEIVKRLQAANAAIEKAGYSVRDGG